MKKLLASSLLMSLGLLTGCVSTKTPKSTLQLEYKPNIFINTDALGDKTCMIELIVTNKSNRTVSFNIKRHVYLYDPQSGNQLANSSFRIKAYQLPHNSSATSDTNYSVSVPLDICSISPKYRVTND